MNWKVNKFQDTDAGPLLKFLPIIKVEEAPDGTVKMVYGMATAEVPDKDNEICDYADTAPQYKSWSDAIFKATTNAGQEASLGNVRIQHTLEVGGKVVKLDFLEAQKQVHIGTEPKDDKIGGEIKRGFYTGYSQGGRYLYRKCNVCKTNMGSGNFCPNCKKDVAVRYAAKIAEVSYVDNPCLGNATFAFVKADGSVELRKFSTVEKTVKYLVTEDDGTTHLPYTGDDGKPDHNLMGAAWAALTSNYRGNPYAGPDKAKALARLKEVYAAEGVDTPSAKCDKVAPDNSNVLELLTTMKGIQKRMEKYSDDQARDEHGRFSSEGAGAQADMASYRANMASYRANAASSQARRSGTSEDHIDAAGRHLAAARAHREAAETTGSSQVDRISHRMDAEGHNIRANFHYTMAEAISRGGKESAAQADGLLKSAAGDQEEKVAKNSECECSCPDCQDGDCEDCSNPDCEDPNCDCNSSEEGKVATAQDLNRVLQPILQRLEARST